MSAEPFQFTVNGQVYQPSVDPEKTLLDFLREDLDLTGTKKGCDNEGQCGACTVLIDGRARRACLTPLNKLHLAEITTVEGLARSGQLHPLQQAFLDHGAVQCGYCTPGMLMASLSVLNKNPLPSADDVRAGLQGNLCRCTGYEAITAAVLEAARVLQGEAPPVDRWPEAFGGDLRRLESVSKVTGALRFAGDRKLQEMLHVRILRSTQHYARLLEINTQPALKIPGVVAVLTAADIPGVRQFSDRLGARDSGTEHSAYPPSLEPILASEIVRMLGEPIAFVAAESVEAAEQGLQAIEVLYKPLEANFDPRRALGPEVPALHPHGNLYELGTLVKGDAQAEIASAEIVVSGRYSLPSQDHATIEPESALAYFEDDGRLVVFGPTHQPHARRDQIAEMLAIPPDQVRVISAPTGGSFGGRHHFWLIVAAALPAYLLQRPVSIVYSRAESLLGTFKRHPFHLEVQIGADREGTFKGLKTRAIGNAGPYGGAPSIAPFVALCGAGPYLWKGIDNRAEVVHTNYANAGPFRGYGMPQGVFGLECTLDELSRRLQIDPLELMLKNASGPLRADSSGQPFDEPFDLAAVLEAIRPDWLAMKQSTATLAAKASATQAYGAGIATAWYQFGKGGNLRVAARVGLDRQGEVTLYYSVQTSGTGLDTTMSQIASHELGIPRQAIKFINGDTDLTPDSETYGACRSTYWVGGAIQNASQSLKSAVLGTASEMLDCPPEVLKIFWDDRLVVGNGQHTVPLSEIAGEWTRTGQPMIHNGALDLNQQMQERGHWETMGHFTVGTAIAQVEVNPANGKVKLLQVVVAQDVGRALNPMELEGQIRGGVMIEAGAALLEEYIPGQTLDFKSYPIPRIKDTPQIGVRLVEVAGKHGPYGAKGVGEAIMGHSKAAILNAIRDAIGVRVVDLPATPTRILQALKTRPAD